ncbi:hypothetical protein [Tianweitania sediminis]|uniref:DUF3828 domain-containing protein n=1 Tax=Tianweitania sediminis TaxID=1502156 RepID=A0A8J7UI93_9HYPH|nr:hypothetical protein [Tianweitania sediminis]MBP0438663.1 hypothetical protein [Tianweitania sediminis]
MTTVALAEPLQSATDFVRALYMSEPIYNPGFDEPFEERLTGPALAAVEKNEDDAAASEGVGCIDFMLSLNAQDADEATVRRTLEVDEVSSETDGRISVEATFIGFEFEGIPADQQTQTVIRYDLLAMDDGWRIADISGKAVGDDEFGWRLSELCQ